MPIPDFQSVLLPLLKFCGDKQEHSLSETIDYLANEFRLTESEKNELLPSGQQAIFANRVGWARTYLKKAGLIESTRRAYFKITNQGIGILKQDLKEMRVNYLKKFPEFLKFHSSKKDKNEQVENDIEKVDDRTPQELLEDGYQKIQYGLAQELLDSVKGCSPKFFEKLVVELLLKMGYGGSIKDAGQAIGQSGDGGIDGIIKEDKLGLDAIFIQAKKWDNSVVGRPEIQKFVGALQGQRAKKGIFITTSNFSKEAQDYTQKIDVKVVLIDGQELAQLMIDYDVGVSRVNSYEIKRIDSDYFSED